MGAQFQIKCPNCGKPTAATAEVFYRWWAPDGKPAEADPTPEPPLDKSQTDAVCSHRGGPSWLAATAPVAETGDLCGLFGSTCPQCHAPLSLILKAEGALIARLASHRDAPGHLAVERLNAGEIKSFHVFRQQIPKPGLKAMLDPSVPADMLKRLSELKEDADKGRNPEGVVRGCEAVLEAVLKALGPPPAKGGLFARAFAAPALGLESRLRGAVRHGQLTRWCLEAWPGRKRHHGEAPPATAEDARARVTHLIGVLRCAYPGPKT